MSRKVLQGSEAVSFLHFLKKIINKQLNLKIFTDTLACSRNPTT